MTGQDIVGLLVLAGVLVLSSFILPERVIYLFLIVLLFSIIIVRWPEILSLLNEIRRSYQ